MSFFTRVVCSFLVLFAVSSHAATQTTPLLTDVDNEEPKQSSSTKEEPKAFDKTKVPIQAVLTVDGGGLRGIICVEVLYVVESAIKKVLRENEDKYWFSKKGELQIDLADYFTAMSGVNSGIWITSYLASKGGKGASAAVFNQKSIINKYGNIRPGSLDGLVVFFEEYGKKIYSQNWEVFSLGRLFKAPWDNIPGFTYVAHPTKHLDETLRLFLGEMTINELDTILFIPAYDLIRRAAVLFVSGNFRGIAEIPAYTYILQTTDKPRTPTQKAWTPNVKVYDNKKYRLRVVAHAGSAEATVHSAKKLSALNDESFELLCQDGGLMANNPTLQTLVFLASTVEGDIGRFSILSIGTGITGGSMTDHKDSGAMQWMLSRDFFTVITQGKSELIQAQLDLFFYFVVRESNNIRRGQYLRVQTSADETRSEGVALQTSDDVTRLDQLRKIGKTTADSFRASINTFVKVYVFGIDLEEYEFKSYIEKDPSRVSSDETEGPKNRKN